jgi:prophage regulatory protein
MSKRFINLQAVEDKTALKKSSIYAKVKAGEFPAPIKMGARTVWIESEVDSWLDAQVAAWRDKTAVSAAAA